MSAPSVYAAIHAVAADFAEHGIAKSHTNVRDGYDYRSIDDVLGRLAPLLAKHRLCILPRVVERSASERMGEGNALLSHVALRAKFALISVDDGTSHDVEVYGEALDAGDKATAKAMSAAYKSAMLQTFCVPVAGQDDADASSSRLMRRIHLAEPIPGWQQWCEDIIDIVGVCESEKAIDTVQERNRSLLMALGRAQPELYAHLGNAVIERRAMLSKRACQKPRKRSAKGGDAPKPGAAARVDEDA